jgi:predicted nucleic acid-binding protein
MASRIGEEAARHALRLLDSFAVQWISCEPNSLEIASRLKAGGRLSVADSWIGATAIAYGATKYWISVCPDSNSA